MLFDINIKYIIEIYLFNGVLYMKIEKKSKVIDTLKDSKNVLKVFKKYGLNCPECRGAGQDSIEMVAGNYGLDLNEFLKELNKAAENK